MDALLALLLIVEVAFALGVVALILVRLLPVDPSDDPAPGDRPHGNSHDRGAARRDDVPA